jgi:hypothetical protein
MWFSTEPVIERLEPDGTVAAVSHATRGGVDYQEVVRDTLRGALMGLPEFEALYRCVDSSHAAGEFLVDANGSAIQGGQERRGWLYDQFLAALLLRCLGDRVMPAVAEETFLPVYLELEHYIGATEFEVVFWAPLADFHAAVWPVWVHCDLAIRPLEQAERTHVLQLGEWRVIDPTHAAGMRFALETRYRTPKHASVDASQANEKFLLAVTAMRLMKSATPAAYVTMHGSARPLLFGPRGDWAARDAPRPARSRVFDLAKQDIHPLQRLYRRLSRLRRSRSFNLAMERFERGVERETLEDSLVDEWVALEALFLKREEQMELSYRAALRIARFLGEGPGQRVELFETMKKSYNARSRVVHGDPLPRDIADTTAFTEEVLRKALRSSVLSGSGPDLDKLDRDAVRADVKE